MALSSISRASPLRKVKIILFNESKKLPQILILMENKTITKHKF